MLIPYVYNPALHDLFLYQPETVTWTLNGGGSAVVAAPYAWNPSSPLYGYRYSLEGLMACYRWMSSCPPYGSTCDPAVLSAIYPQYNAINSVFDFFNAPAWRNSYPPANCIIHPNFGWVCWHAVNGSAIYNYRDLTKVFDSIGGIGSQQMAGFSHRYIKGDNTIVQLSGTTLGFPYQRDISYDPTDGAYIVSPRGGDHGVFELPTPFPGTPLRVVNAQSIYYDTNVWCIDGSQKICGPIAYKRSGYNYDPGQQVGQVRSFMRLTEQTSAPGFSLYLHDSGSTFFIELKPPTSAAAGDGVLGFLPGTVIYIGNLNPIGPSNDPIPSCILVDGDPASALVTAYWTSRGYPDYPFFNLAPRTNQALATESEAQAILADVQALLAIMELRN